jgi:hypothetical protein
LADENSKPIKFQVSARTAFSSAALIEVTFRAPLIGSEPLDEDETADVEIEMMFRRKLMGLRFLPRRQRPAAYRALRQWRFLALRALREKRAAERRARLKLGQQQRPSPR